MSFSRSLVWILLVLLSACSSLLYYPTSIEYISPKQFKLFPEELTIKTGNGNSLAGWYFRRQSQKPSKAVIVYFHGNAENMTSHYLNLLWILANGYDFFIFDYEGYGKSQGSPSPQNTLSDGASVLRAIYQRNSKLPIVVLGQSLGGAVALRTVADLKNEVPVKLVVVDSTFASYRSAARSLLAHNWLTWLFQLLPYLVLSDDAAPLTRIGEISPIPIVVIHGDQDETIHLSLGKEVFRLAKEPKEFWLIPGGAHIESFWRKEPNIREKLLSKLDSLFCKSPCRPEPLHDLEPLQNEKF